MPVSLFIIFYIMITLMVQCSLNALLIWLIHFSSPSVILLAYLNGNGNLCRALVRAGTCLGCVNKDGISIFNAPVATKQLLFKLLGQSNLFIGFFLSSHFIFSLYMYIYILLRMLRKHYWFTWKKRYVLPLYLRFEACLIFI